MFWSIMNTTIGFANNYLEEIQDSGFEGKS